MVPAGASVGVCLARARLAAHVLVLLQCLTLRGSCKVYACCGLRASCFCFDQSVLLMMSMCAYVRFYDHGMIIDHNCQLAIHNKQINIRINAYRKDLPFQTVRLMVLSVPPTGGGVSAGAAGACRTRLVPRRRPAPPRVT